jgi:transposase
MDTSQQATVTPVAEQRQRRSIAEKRRIVEETLAPGASVARVARDRGVNANQVFGWRRLYLAGRLGEQKPGIKLLPVRVSESKSAPLVVEQRVTDVSQPQPGTIHIELRSEYRMNSHIFIRCTHKKVVERISRVTPRAPVRALILAQHQELITKNEQLLSREREIEHLMHRMQFG